MNLNTAIYSKRIKEIQIKKIFGATSQRIAGMLMLESVFFCIIALVIALLIVFLTLPKFGQVFNSPVSFHFNESADLIAGFVLLSIFIGLLSGLYPVFFTLSNKMSVLGNLQNSISSKMSFRNALIVFQFFISISLIMCFLTINKQLGFLHNKNLGFNQEYIITLNAAPNLIEKLDVFRHELRQNPNILSVSGSKRIPSQSLADSNEAKVVNNGNMEPLGFRLANVRIDEYFIPTYEIKLIAGNNITNQNKGAIEYLINHSAVEKIGWKSAEAALGQFIEYGGYKGKVVGVVEDFHYESLHNTISPIIMYFDPSDFDRVSIRVSPSNLSNTVAVI
jgi:putative ABC transport system permease protein